MAVDVPVDHVLEIASPEMCPFRASFLNDCSNCRRANGIISVDENGVKRRYDTSACLKEMVYRHYIAQSGLEGIELKHTFENAVIDKWNQRVYQYLQQWNWKSGEGIYIAAEKSNQNKLGNGTGKSYALHALTHRLCREGVGCYYIRTVDFLQQLKESYEGRSMATETEILERYAKVPVLLLDDIGKENVRTEWAAERFYYLIDTRIRFERPTVYASNFLLSELEERFGLDNFGPAISSRIAGSCVLFTLGGPDRRLLKNAKTT